MKPFDCKDCSCSVISSRIPIGWKYAGADQYLCPICSKCPPTKVESARKTKLRKLF